MSIKIGTSLKIQILTPVTISPTGVDVGTRASIFKKSQVIVICSPVIEQPMFQGVLKHTQSTGFNPQYRHQKISCVWKSHT
jgi:hypothetical protein